MRIIFLTAIVLLCGYCRAQEKGITTEVIGSEFFVSQRTATENGEQKFYTEFRIGYQFNKYLQVNAFVGHQERSFIYYAYFSNPNPWIYYPLFMKRNYVPAGVNLRLYLTEFFYEKLRLFKKPGKWDIYNQVGIAILNGTDKFDSRDDALRNQGAVVPYYIRPYVQEYGRVLFLFVGGLKYNFNKNFGIFLEGGEGALMSLQLGASYHF